MAWTCSARDNAGLVRNLEREGLIKTPRVRQALLAVDRGHYVPTRPYEDSPQGIGDGATISAPHMHAYALELLKENLEEGMSALDVGSGSGILLAAFREMVGPTGCVVGVEHMPRLVKLGVKNLKHAAAEKKDPTRYDNVIVKEGDGRLGDAEHAPFDAIHVGAAADGIPPALLEQLKVGGRMMIPVGPEHGVQELVIVHRRTETDYTQRVVTGVRYVPLCDRKHQESRW